MEIVQSDGHSSTSSKEVGRNSVHKNEEAKTKARLHKPDDGSLLGLFRSEFFDIHMGIEYLYRREEQGIQDYLVNTKLYSESLAHIDFYLPQLCLMVLERPKNNSLIKFLYTTAEKYVNLALKAYWLFLGYTSERRLLKDDYTWPDSIAENIEMRMVNGNAKTYAAMTEAGIDLSLVFNEKIYRAEYISLQNLFVESLTRAAIRLKEVDEGSRSAALNTFFVERNRWIDEQLRAKKVDLNSKYKKYYKGIVLPLEVGDDLDPTLILRVVPELGHCYNTKKRSPYRIAFETIKLYEADQWEVKVAAQPAPEPKEKEKEESKGQLLSPPSGKQNSRPSISKTEPTESLDHELYYKAKFKGFEKFAKYVEMEEKNMEAELAKKPSSGSFGCSPVLRPASGPRRRTHSTERADEYLKAQFKHNGGSMGNNANLARKLSDLDIQTILEKYGKKSATDPGQKAEEFEYISLEKRLEGMEEPFGESWENVTEKCKAKSEYNLFESYEIKPYIVKGNDDLRQEQMAIQFMKRLQEIYSKAGIQIFLRPYEILITSHNSGIIEYIPNTISVDSLKKKFPMNKQWTLSDFYRRYFYDRFEEAQKNFVESLAGYCIFNYILQVKDRHNANILIDRHGHIIHIDFGFFISNYPGGINFESAPFKLTDEYIELMEGVDSEMFLYFKALLIKGMYELRSHAESLIMLIEVMSKGSRFPCFAGGEAGIEGLRERFRCCYSEAQCTTEVENMLYYSIGNWRTTQYDNFQKFTNNIYQ